MKKEDKELLIKDLCARVPYRVNVCLYEKETCILMGIDGDEVYLDVDSDSFYIESIKPYLRPLSSMTEEEKEELFNLCNFYVEEDWEGKKTEVYGIEIASRSDPNYCYDHEFKLWGVNMKAIDWLNKHHFDYRDLIEKDLAIEAPKGMYK